MTQEQAQEARDEQSAWKAGAPVRIMGLTPGSPEAIAKVIEITDRVYKRDNGINLTDRKNENPEADVNIAITQWLRAHKVFYWRSNTMGVKKDEYGYRPTQPWHDLVNGTVERGGMPDFTCIIGGRYVGIESKRPKESKSGMGYQSEPQKLFEANVVAAGGSYFVIRSVEDLERCVRPLL